MATMSPLDASMSSMSLDLSSLHFLKESTTVLATILDVSHLKVVACDHFLSGASTDNDNDNDYKCH